VIGSEAHVSVGRQVHHHIRACHGYSQVLQVQHIPRTKRNRLCSCALAKNSIRPWRSCHSQPLHGIGKQSIGKVAATNPRNP